MNSLLEKTSSTLSSTICSWRGMNSIIDAIKPTLLLELYDREGCPKCRLIRETLTELNLDFIVYPAPIGDSDAKANIENFFGRSDLPLLYDPNTSKKIAGILDIKSFLYGTYGRRHKHQNKIKIIQHYVSSYAASKVRHNRGVFYSHSTKPSALLELYNFESSPFCRLVRERLCEFSIPYIVRQLGKQQRADLGIPSMRFHFGKYKPVPGSRREWFLKKYGTVQVPLLLDPNSGNEIFESTDIIDYLEANYSIG